MNTSSVNAVLCLAAHLCLTLCRPQNVALQAPLSMGFSGQEYWGGLSCPPPGDHPTPGLPRSPTVQADSLPSEPPGKPRVLTDIVKMSSRTGSIYPSMCMITNF